MNIVEEVRAIHKQRTQREAIEDALIQHGVISNGEALAGHYGGKPIRRLGARVWELRDLGYQIRTELQPDGECFYRLMGLPGQQLALL